MTHAYIAEAVRTPRGKGNDKGSLKTIKPAELLAQTLRGLTERSGVDTAQIGDAVFGCVTQTGEQGASVGVRALPLAHWSDKVSGAAVVRRAGSGETQAHRSPCLSNPVLSGAGWMFSLHVRCVSPGKADLRLKGGIDAAVGRAWPLLSACHGMRRQIEVPAARGSCENAGSGPVSSAG